MLLGTITSYEQLTLFTPNVLLPYPWKRQKAKGFLTFSGGIEMGHWREMG